MAHQFLCPRGHLLQADESAGGAQCKCPHCGILFIIPYPAGATPPLAGAASGDDDEEPIIPVWEPEPVERMADLKEQLGFSVPDDEPLEEADADTAVTALDSPRGDDDLLEVVCPKGHKLQAPRRTLETEVACTVCGRRFFLTRQHTIEYLTEKAQQTALRERRLARMWLNWAITAAVMVVGALIALAVISIYR